METQKKQIRDGEREREQKNQKQSARKIFFGQFEIAAGPPPIYVGFGSIVLEDAESTTTIILNAIRAAGVRAIISKGWSNLGGINDDSNVFFIGDCPHEWLFDRVAAVVHHGGAGTTACGLRKSKPTIVVPFFGE